MAGLVAPPSFGISPKACFVSEMVLVTCFIVLFTFVIHNGIAIPM